jgi:hypothetical protein
VVFWYADVPQISKSIKSNSDLKSAGVYILMAEILTLLFVIDFRAGGVWFPVWLAINPAILYWLTQMKGHPGKLPPQMILDYKIKDVLPDDHIKSVTQKVLYLVKLLVNPVVCPLLVRFNQWTNFLTALDLSIKQ